MTIPYRVRRAFQRFCITLGVLAIVILVAFAVWMIWLSRYVVYTKDGAILDFEHPFSPSQGVVAQPPTAGETVPISYGDKEELNPEAMGKLGQLTGYTITEEMLTGDMTQVLAAAEKIPVDSVVLLDVKNVQGRYFYPSALGKSPSNMDTAAFMQLIELLQSRNCYLIARFPALREYDYFLADERTRVPYGLPKANGNGSLWEDKSIKNTLHYWLNPASAGAQSFLVEIINELRTIGFQEVVLGDFRFPDTDKIKFDADKATALNEAANTLVRACATDTFAVSFAGSPLTLPEGRCRLYFEDVFAEEIPELLSQLTVENKAAQLVFLTDLMDTRYDDYGVLRPLELS